MLSTTFKKTAFITYFILLFVGTFFRTVSISIFEYYYNITIFVLSTAVMLQYATHKKRMYLFPVLTSAGVGFVLMILGLTQYSDQIIGGLAFVMGLMLLVTGIIGYLLRNVIDTYLFHTPKRSQQTVDIVISFFFFIIYFLLIGSRIVRIAQTAAITILILFVMVIVYAVVQFVIRLATKKFHYGYVALGVLFGIFLYFRFFPVEAGPMLDNLVIIQLSHGLYLSILFIGDIFYHINVKSRT